MMDSTQHEIRNLLFYIYNSLNSNYFVRLKTKIQQGLEIGNQNFINNIYLKNQNILILAFKVIIIHLFLIKIIRFLKSLIQNLLQMSMKSTEKLKKERQKGVIIISGIPGSGKSYLAKKLCQKLRLNNQDAKIFSTDNLQAFFYENPNASAQETQKIFSNKDWDNLLVEYQLNKQDFDEKVWNLSRKTIENPKILDLLLESCQQLIIEDELVLRSQRKGFKRYCFDKQLRYVQIQLDVTLQEALANNNQRGKYFPFQKVSQQIIKKSFCKYQHNQDSIVLTRIQMSQFINSFNIDSLLKYVQIQDNYSEYLLKKNVQHEFTEKELDENELRKLINLIMIDEIESIKYFPSHVHNKQKATILVHAKKLYLEKKRKVPFLDILSGLISKDK